MQLSFNWWRLASERKSYWEGPIMRTFFKIGTIVSGVALLLAGIGYVTYRWASNQMTLTNEYEFGAVEE